MKAEVMKDGRWVEVDTDTNAVPVGAFVVRRGREFWHVWQIDSRRMHEYVGCKFSRRGARRLALKKAGAWK